MDIVAVGYPSALTAWGFSLLEFVLKNIYPNVIFVNLDRYDDLSDIGSFDGHRLILTSFPSTKFSENCLSHNIFPICFVDSFPDTLEFHQAHGSAPPAALRAVSAGLVLGLPLVRAPGALLIRRVDEPYRNVVETILSHLGLSQSQIDDAAREAVATTNAENETLSTYLKRSFQPDPALPDRTQAMKVLATLVLGGLLEYGLGNTMGNVTWPRECFLNGDRPDTQAPLISSIIGRARIIYYGPYYHLPAGHWTARVVIGFSTDIHFMPFTIEVASGSLLGKARILAQRGGIFDADFSIEVQDPRESIEVRIMSEQAAIEGRIGFLRIEFSDWRPLDAPETEAVPTGTEQADPGTESTVSD